MQLTIGMKKLSLKNYKAIFCDYDGTLVGSDFKISENVKNAIGDWRRAGGKFSIISSKPFQGPIKSTCDIMGLEDPAVVTGGAAIVDPKTEKIISAEHIGEDEVKKISLFLDTLEFMYDMQDHEGQYTKFDQLKKLQPHKKYKNLTNFNFLNVLKIRILTTNTSENKINELISNLEIRFKNLNIIRGYTTYSTGIDITSQKANKHLAVLKLCELLKIEPYQVIGIGDGPNDYPLLMASGYKVAMGDAPQELKEIADYVTSDYKNDGVAKFINKILNL